MAAQRLPTTLRAAPGAGTKPRGEIRGEGHTPLRDSSESAPNVRASC